MKKDKTLKSIMTTDLTVVNVNTSFLEIKKIFAENKFHHLPVLNELRRVEGIISRNDFANLSYSLSQETSGKRYSQKIYEHLTAKDVMTAHPVTLTEDDNISLVARLFLENVYHAIPIEKEGRLIGMVTTHDLLAFAFGEKAVGE